MADQKQYAGGGPEMQQREWSTGAFQQEARMLDQAMRDEIGRRAGAMLRGELQGVAQMPSAPGKMFTRSDILAIIRGQMAVTENAHQREALDTLKRTFERLE